MGVSDQTHAPDRFNLWKLALGTYRPEGWEISKEWTIVEFGYNVFYDWICSVVITADNVTVNSDKLTGTTEYWRYRRSVI